MSEKQKHWAIAVKEENEILKKQNEELNKEFSELAKKVDLLAKSQVDSNLPDEVDEVDDRTEEVTIHYGSVKTDHGGQRQYIQKTMPKQEAFEELVSYYSTKKWKIVPKPDQSDPGRNMATVYCRIGKRDLGTGRKVTAIQEMPIHLAATRALEPNKLVELITKQEYDKYNKEKESINNKWREDVYRAKRDDLIEKLKQTL